MSDIMQHSSLYLNLAGNKVKKYHEIWQNVLLQPANTIHLYILPG